MGDFLPFKTLDLKLNRHKNPLVGITWFDHNLFVVSAQNVFQIILDIQGYPEQ